LKKTQKTFRDDKDIDDMNAEEQLKELEEIAWADRIGEACD
jgi:hypothetical protein